MLFINQAARRADACTARILQNSNKYAYGIVDEPFARLKGGLNPQTVKRWSAEPFIAR